MVTPAGFTTDHIHYLQRSFLAQRVVGDASTMFRGIRNHNDIGLLHIRGLSQFWQDRESKALAARQLMSDLFAGLCAEQIPVFFAVLGTLDRVNLFIGSYRDNESWPWPLSRGEVVGDVQTIAGSLEGAFPGIFLEECTAAKWNGVYSIIRQARGCSLITGTPTAKLGNDQLGVEQIERLIRGMYGRHWGYLVIAKPLPFHITTNLYNDALNELREVSDAQSATGASPIADAYADLVKLYLARHTVGQTVGLWRVTAYCLGADPLSYLRVRAVVQAVFGGQDSLPDPLRQIDCFSYALQVAHLGQVVLPCQHPNPGRIAYPYEYASVLNSFELATLAHLPQEEMPGYVIQEYARFDVSPPLPDTSGDGKQLCIGEIQDRGHPTGNNYSLCLDRLSEHALIVGVTGSGKTNTAFHLLTGAWRQGISFLVIEPAKREYRELLDEAKHPGVGRSLQVFTLGDERVSPFRLNPFEVTPGIPVQTHIDLLKSVFNASFAMYGPMPHVLEQCLYEIYVDRGWDLTTGLCRRGQHHRAYPTLSDLYAKIDVVVDRLGYGPRITPELRAALKVRVNSLRLGGKGLMMDTPRSVPIASLLERPTVLELEAIGDDDEKAFIVGLLWIFLYEHYRAHPKPADVALSHLTLVEEAHRLLTDVPKTVNPEIANTRGKAVETFCHMLSEVRAYGEGVLIAEQIPVRLASDAVKNTSLKIMHRLVSDEDRMIVGSSMNLDEHQLRYVATLGKGDAAVYAEGDDRSYQVHVPLCKGGASGNALVMAGLDEPEIQILDSTLMDAIRIVDQDELEIDIEPDQQKIDIQMLNEPDESVIDQEQGSTSRPLAESCVLGSDQVSPLQIKVSDMDEFSSEDARIKAHMEAFRSQKKTRDIYNQPFLGCPTCSGPCTHQSLARMVAARPSVQQAFAKAVLTAVHEPTLLWQGLHRTDELVRRCLPHREPEPALFVVIRRLLIDGHLGALGNAYQWAYQDVDRLQSLLLAAVEQTAEDGTRPLQLAQDSSAITELKSVYHDLCRRAFDPFPECSQVCPASCCLYRFHLAAQVRDPWLDQRYKGAFSTGKTQSSGSLQTQAALRRTAQAAARRILAEEAPEEAKLRAQACYLVQKAYAWSDADEEQRHRAAQWGLLAIRQAEQVAS